MSSLGTPLLFQSKRISYSLLYRAYVVPRDKALLKDPSFPPAIQRWIKGKVAHYKELRGGQYAPPDHNPSLVLIATG